MLQELSDYCEHLEIRQRTLCQAAAQLRVGVHVLFFNNCLLDLLFSVDKLSHSSIGMLGCLFSDAQQVHPWMLGRPVHDADGRLANHPNSPCEQ
ncbi:hypothetical protein HG547_17705 [Shewanella sp. DNRA4]|nr:hypothetical protein [Shewanella sp. DNRA4]